jgi:NADH-quinone oxidoreductase subunit A
MNNILLSPPLAFVIVLAAMLIFSKLLSGLSCKPKTHGEGECKSYACGEEAPTNLVQPDYSQFFPFAFFFTLLHVFTLTIATVPALTGGSFAVAVIYILAAITGMVILFRR